MPDDPSIDPAPTDPPAEPPAGDPPADPPADPPKANGADDPPADPPAAGDWRASIEDADLRKVADRFTSPADMAKAMVDLRKRDSQIRVPGKDATDKDKEAFNKAIGVPEEAAGYEFALPEGRDPTDDDKAFQSAAGEVFHKLNINVDQAKGLNEWWNEFNALAQQAQVDADKEYAGETEAALKKEWPGAEFDRNKAFADGAARELFGDGIEEVRNIETKDGRFVLDHPAFVKILARYGREMEEGTIGSTMTEGDQNATQTKIEELDKEIDKANAEGDRSKANRIYQEQQELFRKLPGGAALAVGAAGRAA